MEKYRGALKRRLILSIVYGVALAALTAVGIAVGVRRQAPGLMLSFDIGFCVGIEAVMVFFICKYAAAYRSAEKLKALYIAENDERTKYIAARIGDAGFHFVLGGLACATLVAGFFSTAVFFTLLSCLVFTILVKLSLTFYYTRKV